MKELSPSFQYHDHVGPILFDQWKTDCMEKQVGPDGQPQNRLYREDCFRENQLI